MHKGSGKESGDAVSQPVPTGPGLPQNASGPRADNPPATEPPPGDGGMKSRSIFDLDEDEVVTFRSDTIVAAPRRRFPLKPLMKTGAVMLVVLLTVLLLVAAWPSSSTTVPRLVGKQLKEAQGEARSSNLDPEVVLWEYSGDKPSGIVISQDPAAGNKVSKGTKVALIVSKGATAASGEMETVGGPAGDLEGITVVIDPAQQLVATGPDWLDPRQTKRTPADKGYNGTASGNPGYLINLDISFRLEELLQERGATVMFTHDGSGGSAVKAEERAAVAEESEADLLVSVHYNFSDDGQLRGIETVSPAKDAFNREIYESSRTAALRIQEGITAAGLSEDLGVVSTKELPLFNWSTRPVVQVRTGYISNRADDAMLGNEGKRQQIANGICEGILAFFRSR